MIPYTPFTHNFWVLTNPYNIPMDQIHGLAVNPETGETKAIGSSADVLQVVRDAAIIWSLQQNQPTKVCLAACEAEIKDRWQTACNAIPEINALKLPYPDWWQHFYKKNSNTVFNTIGRIMGFSSPVHLLPTWAPGIRLIISQDIINRYCHHSSAASFCR